MRTLAWIPGSLVFPTRSVATYHRLGNSGNRHTQRTSVWACLGGAWGVPNRPCRILLTAHDQMAA